MAALELIDGPVQHAPRDFVPTVDQEEPAASYADWTKDQTVIITCRIANDLYKGRRFESRDEAVQTVQREYGRILEANYIPGRAFLRVMKP